jgi:hypothetical protein
MSLLFCFALLWQKFLIEKKLLFKMPESKLGRMAMSGELAEDREHYFDRTHKMVDSILDLYRTGQLHIPSSMCSIQVMQVRTLTTYTFLRKDKD